MDEQKQPGIRINQVFLAGAEFRHRPDYLTVPPRTDLGDLELDFTAQVLVANEGKSAAIKVRVANTTASKPLYEFAVEMVAIVSAVSGEENLPPLEYVNRAGMAMMIPFIREAIANITSRGRFGPIWLKPLNVLAMLHSLEPEVAESAKV